MKYHVERAVALRRGGSSVKRKQGLWRSGEGFSGKVRFGEDGRITKEAGGVVAGRHIKKTSLGGNIYTFVTPVASFSLECARLGDGVYEEEAGLKAKLLSWFSFCSRLPGKSLHHRF